MGILGNIFKSDRLKEPVDLSLIGTDLHSHLIPGLDDGSQSLEESVELIRRLMNMGYKKIVTTPHVMSDYFKNTSEKINKGLDELRNELAKHSIPVAVDAAAEYMFDSGFIAKFRKGELLTFGNNYVLVELSGHIPPEHFIEIMFEMKMNGYNPVLAHPERYVYWHYNFEHYVTLKDRDILFQINVPTLSGAYSPAIKKICEEIIDNNMADFAGTDIHNHEYFALLEKARFSPHLEKLVSSGKLLNNTL